MLVIMTTLIFFYSKLQGIPYPFCTLNTTATGQNLLAGNQTPKRRKCTHHSCFSATCCPSKEGLKVQVKIGSDCKVNMQILPLKVTWYLFQGLTMDTELRFTYLKSIILTFPSKEKKKEKEK